MSDLTTGRMGFGGFEMTVLATWADAIPDWWIWAGLVGVVVGPMVLLWLIDRKWGGEE